MVPALLLMLLLLPVRPFSVSFAFFFPGSHRGILLVLLGLVDDRVEGSAHRHDAAFVKHGLYALINNMLVIRGQIGVPNFRRTRRFVVMRHTSRGCCCWSDILVPTGNQFSVGICICIFNAGFVREGGRRFLLGKPCNIHGGWPSSG